MNPTYMLISISVAIIVLIVICVFRYSVRKNRKLTNTLFVFIKEAFADEEYRLDVLEVKHDKTKVHPTLILSACVDINTVYKYIKKILSCRDIAVTVNKISDTEYAFILKDKKVGRTFMLELIDTTSLQKQKLQSLTRSYWLTVA